jgi:competence protein ComEC
MRPSHLSYGFLSAFLIVIAMQAWPLGIMVALGIAGVLSGIGTVLISMRHFYGGSLALALILGIAVASIVITTSRHVSGPGDIENFARGETATIHGQIVDAPDIRPTVTKFTIEVESIEVEGKRVPAHGRVLINDIGGWPEHAYGEWISAKGTLERPKPIEDFAYDKYLALRGITAVMQRARVVKEEGEPITLPMRTLRALINLRSWCEATINRLLPEPQASLLAGLLVGSRRGLPEHVTDDFRASGITHIVAISGYNITIILAVLSSLLWWLPMRKRLPILIGGITLFTLLVGASASVVRAAIMGILGLIALAAGRQATVRLSILWTAFVMLCWNPLSLLHDPGFQLSFLAVIGLSELSTPLGRLLRCVPKTGGLREGLVATLAAQITTLPLTIVLFHQISFVAPLTNILVAPLVPIAMLLGFIATIIGAMSIPAGLMVAYPTWLLLKLIIVMAHLCANLPLAVITW